MFTSRPAPSTEFRGGSHCDSQIGWGRHICKVLPGCITKHSKTPTNVHIAVLHLWLWKLRDNVVKLRLPTRIYAKVLEFT